MITSRCPPHTFQSARSFLALEELQLKHDDKTEAGQAFLAGHGGPANSGGSASHGGSSGHGAPSSGTSGSPGGDTRGNRGYRTKNKRRGRGSNSSKAAGTGSSNPGGANVGGGSTGGATPRPPVPWAAGYNPWTGLVQSWPMPFRIPGSDRKSTRLNSSHRLTSRMPSSA